MKDLGNSAADEVIKQISPSFIRLFMRYINRMFTKRFDGVRVLGKLPETVPQDRSTIFFCNHAGWYDPLLMLLVSETFLPKHATAGPMDAEALAKYGFMKKIGIFGVEQDSLRGAAHFLKVSRGLLAEPGRALVITPQGEFSDVRKRPVAFKPGLAKLAADCDCILQPFAIEYVFWDEPRPEILMHFGDPIDTRKTKMSSEKWQSHLEGALASAQDELAKAAMARDSDLFVSLIDGQSGVNPIYDAWRYLKALVKGERFSAAHKDIGKD